MSNFTTKEILIGAAVGSLIVSATAILLAPKSGRQIRKDIGDMYDDISDRTHHAADSMIKKTRCLMNMSCQEPDWSDKAKSLLSDMAGYLTCSKKKTLKCDLFEKHGTEFMVGTLAGAIVGAVAGLLLAPKPGDKLRGDFADMYDEMSDKTQEFADSVQKRGRKIAKTARSRANKWLDLAQTVVNQFVDNAEDINEHVTEKVKDYADAGKERIGQILEWAELGLKVWKGLNKS